MNKRFAWFVLSISFLVSVLLLASRPVAAIGPTIKWVDAAGGSDANDGNTEATAYATLQTAVANTESGLDAANRSFIYVKNGTYTEPGLATTCEGLPGSVYILNLDWLTIQAAPGQEPVIKPAAGIISMVVQGSDHLTIDNIDSDQTVGGTDNWHVCDADDLTLRNSRFEGGIDGIDFHTTLTAALIEGNTFTNITGSGGNEVLDFTDFEAANVVIQDNVFTNNGRQITVFPPAGTSGNFTIQRNLMNGATVNEHIRLIKLTDSTIVNNVLMNSVQEGLYIDTGCSNINVWHNTFFNNSLEVSASTYGEIRTNVVTADIDIRNNIIHGNGTNPAILTSVASLPGEDYNLVYNYQPTGAFTTFGTNTIVGQNPLFVSTTSGSEDLHLTINSPAIEAAPTLGVTDDKDKGARPNPTGSDPDMGAYEFPATMGTLRVIKDSQPDDPQDFDFRLVRPVPGFLLDSFTLDDDSDDTLSNTYERELEPNLYIVQEIGTVGWELVDIKCDSTDPDREIFGPFDDENGGFYISFELAAGETITCTFVNQPESTSFGFCPAENEQVGTLRTDLLGTGQGNTTKGIKTRKLVIPNPTDVASLYGQLAAVDVGVMKYVRFRYPNNTYEQINAPTSPAYQKYAVSWWGADLDTGFNYVKGQFFWGLKGNKSPRAFVLWPTYDTGVDRYANVFKTFDISSENQVAADAGWIQSQTQVVSIPEVQQNGATVVVKIAIVDNNKDARPIILDVTLGSETQTRIDTVPNARDTLNIYELVFENVPEGTNEVTILLTSPMPGAEYQAGGDSAAVIGAAISYACGEGPR